MQVILYELRGAFCRDCPLAQMIKKPALLDCRYPAVFKPHAPSSLIMKPVDCTSGIPECQPQGHRQLIPSVLHINQQCELRWAMVWTGVFSGIARVHIVVLEEQSDRKPMPKTRFMMESSDRFQSSPGSCAGRDASASLCAIDRCQCMSKCPLGHVHKANSEKRKNLHFQIDSHLILPPEIPFAVAIDPAEYRMAFKGL